MNAVRLDLQFMQSLSPTQNLVQSLVCAELKQDVHIIVVFEEVLKTDDVLVLKRSVDFDFREKLWFIHLLSILLSSW